MMVMAKYVCAARRAARVSSWMTMTREVSDMISKKMKVV